MKIPKAWHNVPLCNWVAFAATDKEKTKDQAEDVRLAIKRAMLVLDCSVDEARKIPLKDLGKLAKLYRTELPGMLIERFRLNGILYRVETRLNRLPSGHIEKLVADASYIKSGRVVSAMNTKGEIDRCHQAIFNVCQPLRRKWIKIFGIPLCYIYEPYEFEVHEIENRVKDFERLPLGIANPIRVFFFSSLERLLKSRLGLGGSRDEEAEEGTEFSYGGLKERYGWYVILDAMAGGDPFKIKYFEDMAFGEFIMMVKFYLDKQEERENQRRAHELKNKYGG